VLFGRRTYELFEKFWKHAVDDSSTAPDPHHRGERTKEHRAIAIWLNQITKLVFSRTMKNATWKNSRVLHEFDPREIETMKSQPGKDMMIFGSGTIVSQLTQHGLIDEYQFVVCPIPPRKRPAVAQQCVDGFETRSCGSQTVPLRRHPASLCSAELEPYATRHRSGKDCMRSRCNIVCPDLVEERRSRLLKPLAFLRNTANPFKHGSRFTHLTALICIFAGRFSYDLESFIRISARYKSSTCGPGVAKS